MLIRVRRTTTNPAAAWASVNPYLQPLEMGVEEEAPNKAKINFSQDTPVRWNSLDYWNPSGEVGGGGGAWGSITGDLEDQTDLQTELDAKADSSAVTTALAGKVPTTRTVNGHALSGDVTVTKSDVGLGNADNTSDANKPISTAQAAVNATKVDGTPGVKVYRALLTQSVTDAPSATVLENSLGGIVAWSFADTGKYIGELVGAFPTASKVACSPLGFSQNLEGVSVLPAGCVWRFDADSLRIFTFILDPSSGSLNANNGVLDGTLVEVLIYP